MKDSGKIFHQDCLDGKSGKQKLQKYRFNPKAHLPKRATLKSKSIKVGSIDNLEGYAVLVMGQEIGLSLIPEVKVEAGGQVRINKARWFVNYDTQAGKAITGPFDSVKQAQGIASLLANTDWTRQVEEISKENVRAAVKMARMNREELGFARHMDRVKLNN